MGQPGERKGCEGKKDGQVKLHICHRNLIADDAEEHEKNHTEDQAEDGRRPMKNEIEDSMDLHRLIDDRRCDGHSLLHDERWI